jgi:hypothetical protein
MANPVGESESGALRLARTVAMRWLVCSGSLCSVDSPATKT